MQSKFDFLDAVKVRHGLTSDNQLALLLGTGRQTVSNYRRSPQRMSDEIAIRIADLLDIEPGIVLAAVYADRAKSEEAKGAWKRLYIKLGGTAAGIVIAFCLAVAAPKSAFAAMTYTIPNELHRLYIQCISGFYERHVWARGGKPSHPL